MSTPTGAGGGFLLADASPGEVFTREDLTPAQQMFGRVAEDFMRTEVLPRDAEIHAKDCSRELLEGVRRLTRHTPPNTVAARRRIADAVLKAGRYPL